MFTDSHAHLGYDSLYENMEDVLARARNAHVKTIINICTDKETAERGLLLAKKHPFIFNVGATTPHDVEKEGELYFSYFEKLALEKKLVGIGETGLDYFYEHSNRKLQKEFLIRYMQLAKQTHLPLVIHCRDAFDDLFAITDEEFQGRPLLLHCFTGGKVEAKKALDRGFMISFSGIVTFKKSDLLKEAAAYVPLEHIFIETDSPYLAPLSKRGKVNEPSFLVETAATIAAIKKISLEEVGRVTSKNVQKFFNLPLLD